MHSEVFQEEGNCGSAEGPAQDLSTSEITVMQLASPNICEQHPL